MAPAIREKLENLIEKLRELNRKIDRFKIRNKKYGGLSSSKKIKEMGPC